MARSVAFDIVANDKASAQLIAVGQSIEKVERQVEALNRKAVELDVDTAGTERQLAILREELRGATGDRRIEITADISRVEAQMARLRDAKVKVEVEKAAAEVHLEEVKGKVDRLDGRKVNIKVDVDSGGAMARLSALAGALPNSSGGLFGLPAMIGGAASAASEISSNLAGLGGLGALGVTAFGSIQAGIHGVGDALSAMDKKDSASSGTMTSNANAVASAVEGVAKAKRAVEAAVRAVAGAEHDEQNAAYGVGTAQRDAARAYQGIADAKRAVEKASEGVTDAQHSEAQAAHAVEQAQDGVRRADEAVATAEQTLIDAKKSAQVAENDLTDARKQATQQLKDLERQTEDMRMSQADATLSVFEAEQRLQEVMVDPKATDLQRARARLAIDEALQRQKEVGEDAKKLADKKAEADKKGVEGSDLVQNALDRQQAAQRAIVDAEKAVVDAHRNVAEAQRGVTEAEYAHAKALLQVRDAHQSVADAQRRVTEAQDAYKDSQKRVTDALYGVQQATQKIADAQQAVKDRTWDVTQAQHAVQEASKQAGTQGSAAANELAAAMRRLTPEGRAFVTFLHDQFIPAFDKIRDAGQANILPGVQSALQSLIPYTDSLAKSFGAVSKNLGDMFAKIGPHLGPALDAFGRLATIASDKAFGDLGKIVSDLLDDFTAWANGQTPGDIQKQIGNIETDLGTAMAAAYLLWTALKDTGDVTNKIGDVADSIGALQGVMDTTSGVMTGNWDKSWDGMSGYMKSSLLSAVNFVGPALDKMFHGLGSILVHIPGFHTLGQAMLDVGDNTTRTKDAIRGAVPVGAQYVDTTANATTKLNDHTAAGRANIDKMHELIRTTQDRIDSTGRDGRATGETSTRYREGHDKLVELSRQMGMTKVDAEHYADTNLHTLTPALAASTGAADRATTAHKNLGSAATTAGNDANNAATAHSTADSKIKTVALAPIRFVVNDVFGGMVTAFNSIAGVIPGVPKLPVPHVNFATGGLISGPGHGTSDDVPIMASNGEWVIRAAAAKKLGPQAMHLINQADKYQVSGDVATTVLRPKFADGGPVDPAIVSRVAAVKSWLPSLSSHPYVWGAVGPGGYDCSGLVGEVWARLTGRSSYNRYMTTTSILSSPGSYGFSPGPGMFTVGVSNEHTDGNLNGLGFEAPHTGVNVRIGGSAQPTSNFPSQFHLTSLGTAGAGSGGGGGGGFFDPIGWAKSAAKAVVDKLTGGWWGNLGSSGILGKLGIGAGKALMGGIFDNGGMLHPGLTLAYNGTGEAEHILTARQAADADRQRRIASSYLQRKATAPTDTERILNSYLRYKATQPAVTDKQRIANSYLQYKAVSNADYLRHKVVNSVAKTSGTAAHPTVAVHPAAAVHPTAAALPAGGVTINVVVNNAVVGSEQQVARYITQVIRSAVESGTLRFATRAR